MREEVLNNYVIITYEVERVAVPGREGRDYDDRDSREDVTLPAEKKINMDDFDEKLTKIFCCLTETSLK